MSRALVNVAVDSCRGLEGGAPRSLYDPCAGSGTNLYSAALRGLRASGSDRDATKVAGCRRNLDHVRLPGSVATVDASEDAARLLHRAADADCCVLNLPWGEKVREAFRGDNDKILANVSRACRPQGGNRGLQCHFNFRM